MEKTLKIGKVVSDKDRFISLIKEVKDRIVDSEEYGNNTDFIDEDGIVLMQITQTEDPEIVNVLFTEVDEVYSVNKSQISSIA